MMNFKKVLGLKVVADHMKSVPLVAFSLELPMMMKVFPTLIGGKLGLKKVCRGIARE